MAMSCCCPATRPPCTIRSSMPPPGVPLLPGAVSVPSPRGRGSPMPELDAYGAHSPQESIDYAGCACNVDICVGSGWQGGVTGASNKSPAFYSDNSTLLDVP